MHVELLRQLGQRLLALHGSQRHLRLKGRAVVPARSSGHRLSCSAAILPRQAETPLIPLFRFPGPPLYYPLNAQDRAIERRRRQRKLCRNPALCDYIIAGLERCWSPEQIAGRLRHATGDSGAVCHETIYRYVYGPEGREAGLHRHLPKARRRRQQRYGRKPRSSPIPVSRAIQHRPTEVEDRKTFGHWEADLLIFRREHGKANLTSMIERQTRYTILLPNPDRQSNALIGRIGQAWQGLPEGSCRTVTFDRGTEFAAYAVLAKASGTEAYFCDPHSPWQKGAVENANGRLRRYLPGELDLASITPAYLEEIESRMNSTPRKCSASGRLTKRSLPWLTDDHGRCRTHMEPARPARGKSGSRRPTLRPSSHTVAPRAPRPFRVSCGPSLLWGCRSVGLADIAAWLGAWAWGGTRRRSATTTSTPRCCRG